MSDEVAIRDVITAMYAMVSGPAGPRDWAAQEAVFHPDARQMRTGLDEAGKPWVKIMSIRDYRENTKAFFATNDFFEVELFCDIQIFGNMAHAWSGYEARSSLTDDIPERRGINSIQLYKDETGRWQIMSMIWDNERAGLALPERP